MNKRMVLLTGGLAVAMVTVGGTALAADPGPVSSTGVITGCYTSGGVNGSHALFLQDAQPGGSLNCPKGTSAVIWGEQGPVGPAGPAGAAGAAGSQGPQGPAGAGATVAQLSSGNTNCPDGGASITGGGNTVYACNGDSSSNIDYGTLDITYEPESYSSGTYVYYCSISAHGADAATLAISVDPSGQGCDVTGFSSYIASFQLTALSPSPPVGCLPSSTSDQLQVSGAATEEAQLWFASGASGSCTAILGGYSGTYTPGYYSFTAYLTS